VRNIVDNNYTLSIMLM